MTREQILARLRYEFDRALDIGPVALIGWLAGAALALALVAGLFLALFGIVPEGGSRLGFGEATWAALMRALNAGTVAGDGGWGFRLVMLIVTLAGLLMVAAVIGVVSAAIAARRDRLRRGRSPVTASGHVVILNWNPAIFDVVAELALAQAAMRTVRIVIMADRDKAEMEAAIEARVSGLGKADVICRTGDPTDPVDLSIVAPEAAHAVIVLSPEGDGPDSQVIKTILALVHAPDRREAPYRIVAEIRNARQAETARFAGGREVQLVLTDDLLAQISVRACRQSGLAEVYSDLLDGSDCRILAIDQPILAGNRFGDALMAYDTSTLIGLARPDGSVVLNPPMETVITPGTMAVMIVGNDAVAISTDHISVDVGALRPPPALERRPERTMVLGWNRRAPAMVMELSRLAAPGSVLTIAADRPDLEAEVRALKVIGRNLDVEYGQVDISDRSVLEGLDAAAYDQVLLLGSDRLAVQAGDTNTLMTLLNLRQIAEGIGARLNIVSELGDGRNRALAAARGIGETILSNHLAGRMLARAVENPHLGAVFDDLLGETGPKICMRPVADYVEIDRPVNFYTISEVVRRRGAVAFGYARPRAEAPNTHSRGGIVINPVKSELISFLATDRIIVLARD